MTTVLFIHSAGPQGPGEGSSALVSGLHAVLPSRVTLLSPLMPQPDAPEAQPWRNAIAAEMQAIEGDFILLGHLLGGSSLLQVLARSGLPDRLLGVVTLAAPFWGAPGWAFDDFALPGDAGEKLLGLRHLLILRGEDDDVVAPDHPQRYKAVLPQAEMRILPGVDHEAANAAPAVLAALGAITAL